MGKTRVERRTLADGTVKEYRYASRGRTKPAAQTVAAVIAAWQRSVEWHALSPKTQDNYVIYLKPLYGTAKIDPIAGVQRRHLMALRDGIALKRGQGAAMNFCRTASAFFAWAVERNYINASPATRLARKLKRGELPTWRDDQAQLAMRELPEPYRRAVVLAYHTGQRRGDLCALLWSDYDGQTIRLTQEKTDEPLRIPVVPALRAELEAWKAERSTVTILEFLDKPWRPAFLSKRLPDKLEEIGLTRKLGLHGLRKLTAVRLAEAGCTPHEIAAITGHRTLAMIQHYSKAASQQKLADVAVLRLGKRKPTRKVMD